MNDDPNCPYWNKMEPALHRLISFNHYNENFNWKYDLEVNRLAYIK